MIALPPLADLEDALWLALLQIADRHPDNWTLVGGQMVLLHAIEHGVSPPRVSTDLDLVVDARVRPPAIPAMAACLRDLGFEVDSIAPDGIGHRFVRDVVTIDVLAPEGAGERADLSLGGGAATMPIPGGTYALNRTSLIDVSVAGRGGRLPRPDIAGAIVIKALAAQTDRGRGPDRHLSDLAFLFSLVGDPFLLAEDLGDANRRRVRRVAGLADGANPAWGAMAPAVQSNAKAAFTLVTGLEVT